jgi:two-component sensor histidine kinase
MKSGTGRHERTEGHRSPMLNARWLMRVAPPLGSFRSCAAAGALLGVGLLIRLPLDALAQAPLPPYITIYPLLPVVGFVAGLRVGAAVVFAALGLAWYFWIEPVGSFAIPNLRTGLTLLIFCIAGPVAVAFGALARHALERLADQQMAAETKAREAVHRVKNILAAVSAVLAAEGRRTRDVNALVAHVEDMLRAMARAQDVLVGAGDTPASLSQVIDAGLATCRTNDRLRLTTGPDMALPPGDFTGLVLALHELCTNSFKYGALGTDAGGVEVSWSDGDPCWLRWTEQGVRVAAAPDNFGSRIIRGALARIPDGKVVYERKPDEIRCEFSWPAA